MNPARATLLVALLCSVTAGEKPRADEEPVTAIETKIKPGDTVIVSKDGTTLGVEGKVIAELKKGTRIAVTHVNDLWIGGKVTIDGKLQWGWVKRDDVVLAAVLENATSQPWSYQARFSGNDGWSRVLTLPPGQQHAYAATNRLVIRFQNGDHPTTTVINPGERFRYQHGELVNCLTAAASRPKLRGIRVLAVADETYRQKFPDWKDRIAEIVATVSNRYEDAVSLRLELMDCQSWNYEAPRRGETMTTVANLMAADSADSDLVIGWIAAVQAAGKTENWYGLGWAASFGRHILVVDNERRQLPGATLILMREVAQTFGAFRVVDKTSMMRWALEAVPIDYAFGDTVREVIL